MIRYLKQSKIILFFRILLEKLVESVVYAKYIANGGRNKDKDKFRTDLDIRTHALEKGMSIGSVKVGFGKEKAIGIISDLKRFLSIGGDKDVVSNYCGILWKYVSFNEELGADMSDIRSSIEALEKSEGLKRVECGGIIRKNRQDLLSSLDSSFPVFSQTRYSVRDFGETPVSISVLERALKMCEKTPSACNRQPWKVYIYKSDAIRDKLFELQKGCNGFYKEMQYGVLICGDLCAYNINELHQLYVDGGMYAMNFLYSLHSLGVAAIPLTMGHKPSVIKGIKKSMGIKESYFPVILIGVGSYPDNYKVAVSHRMDYRKYTSFV